MEFAKPPLTNQQLAELLLSRGLEHPGTTREQAAASIASRLENVGYYRLSGYWFPFLGENEMFVAGTTFDAIWERYTFDRQLRLLVLDGIERVEVHLRGAISNKLALEAGPFAYQYPHALPGLAEGQHARLLATCIGNYHRSGELFARHFKDRHGDTHVLPPIWMMVDMLEFGKVVTLYEGMGRDGRTDIAHGLGTDPKMLQSWLKTLNDVRNMCCHHARLWNRVFGRKPQIPRRWNSLAFDNPRLYAILTVLLYLMPRVAPTSTWPARLADLLAGHPALPFEPMGFRPGWEHDPIWLETLVPGALAPIAARATLAR